MFNIDFIYTILFYMPVLQRTADQIQWLQLVTYSLKQTYESFVAFREYILYDINFTGQTMYLEKKLQDTFSCPGIYISDGEIQFQLLLSNKSEGHLPVYVGNNWKDDISYTTNEEIVFDNYFYKCIQDAPAGTLPTELTYFEKGEQIPFIQNVSEYQDDYDFYVNVPPSCYNLITEDDLLKMQSIINQYLVFGARYQIKPV